MTPRDTYRVQAYWQILDLIAEGQLVPAEKWSEQRLATTLGVPARTPGLREALAMLAADGFIDQRPQVGFWVQPMSWDELLELQRLRSGVEARIALSLIARPSETALKDARATLDIAESYANNGDVAGFAKTEAEFHVNLARSAASPLAVRVLEPWMIRLRMYCPGLVVLDTDAMLETISDDRVWLDAIERLDNRAAIDMTESIMDRHTDRLQMSSAAPPPTVRQAATNQHDLALAT